MYIPDEIAETGGETLKEYINIQKEIDIFYKKRSDISSSIQEHWNAVGGLMSEYLPKKRKKLYIEVHPTHLSYPSTTKQEDEKEEVSPLMKVYEIEYILNNLKTLLLDEVVINNNGLDLKEKEKEILDGRDTKHDTN